ncbi:glycosyltransferase family 2 protein, partial [Raoultella ornithinolytica]
MTYDKVSVYITTYNRCDRLFRAINSVIKQTYNDFEILVCDDASTDNTETMMTELVKHDNRVRYFRNSTNMGACYSRNVGINNATGKFITGLDDDDEFTDDRLNLFINKWDDKYSFLCANFFEVYPDKKFKHYID